MVDGLAVVWDAAAVTHRYRTADDGRRRGPATAALVLCGVLLSAACTSSTRSAEVEVVRVLLADDWASAAAITAAVVDFEQDQPGVRVVLDGAPFSHIPDLVRAANDTGRPYDLVQWHAFALGAQGTAQPVGDLWEQFGVDPDEWLPGAVEDVTWNGEIYGVPLDTNALVLLVNRDIARAADVDADDLATWEGFRAAAERMTEGEVSGYAVGASNWHSFGWVRAFGGNTTVDGEATLDDPANVRMLAEFADMIADGSAVRPSARHVADDALGLFQAGLVGMHTSGTWDVSRLRGLPDGFEVEVLPLPRATSDAGTALGGSSLAIPVGAAHRELAFTLMLHLTDDDLALRLAEEEGRMPARHRVLADPYFRAPRFATVVAELPRASAMRLIAFPLAEQAFADAVEDALLGRRDPAAALADAQRLASAELAALR